MRIELEGVVTINWSEGEHVGKYVQDPPHLRGAQVMGQREVANGSLGWVSLRLDREHPDGTGKIVVDLGDVVLVEAHPSEDNLLESAR